MKLSELFNTLQPINELMDQPAAWSWKRQGERSWEAMFKTPQGNYWAYLDGKDGEDVDLTFQDQDGSEDINGQNNAFLVFATISDIVADYLQHRHPQRLCFTAKEASRIKLYNRMARQLASKYNGEVENYSDGAAQGYAVRLMEDGKIVPGVNTTCDVQPGETHRQAVKFGNALDAQGRPPLLQGSYGDQSARYSANRGDAKYGPDGTKIKGARK